MQSEDIITTLEQSQRLMDVLGNRETVFCYVSYAGVQYPTERAVDPTLKDRTDLIPAYTAEELIAIANTNKEEPQGRLVDILYGKIIAAKEKIASDTQPTDKSEAEKH